MAEMKNICGKIPVELHEKVRAEIEEKGNKYTNIHPAGDRRTL